MTIVDVDEPDRLDDEDPTDSASFDVFLSYDSADGRPVRDVARRLREAGVTVWFDKESLVPGDGWQVELSARLMDSRACAVFVGPQ